MSIKPLDALTCGMMENKSSAQSGLLKKYSIDQ